MEWNGMEINDTHTLTVDRIIMKRNNFAHMFLLTILIFLRFALGVGSTAHAFKHGFSDTTIKAGLDSMALPILQLFDTLAIILDRPVLSSEQSGTA